MITYGSICSNGGSNPLSSSASPRKPPLLHRLQPALLRGQVQRRMVLPVRHVAVGAALARADRRCHVQPKSFSVVRRPKSHPFPPLPPPSPTPWVLAHQKPTPSSPIPPLRRFFCAPRIRRPRLQEPPHRRGVALARGLVQRRAALGVLASLRMLQIGSGWFQGLLAWNFWGDALCFFAFGAGGIWGCGWNSALAVVLQPSTKRGCFQRGCMQEGKGRDLRTSMLLVAREGSLGQLGCVI